MYATLVLGAVIVVIYLLHYHQRRRIRTLINQIPGPPTIPLLGNAHQLRMGHEWYLQILEFAETFRSAGILKLWLSVHPIIGVSKPEYVEQVLSSMKHIDKSNEYRFLHPWLGTGLLTSTGDKWQRRRKMLTPTFHFNILNDFLPVFNKQSRVLVEKLREKAKNGPFNVFNDLALCALDIISETAMGKEVNAQSTDSQYVQAVYRMSTLVDTRMRKPWFWPKILYNTIGYGREHDEKLKVLHNFTNSVIADKLKEFDQTKAELVRQELKGDVIDDRPKKVRLAFLDMLLYMSDNLTKLTMEEIREEVDTFMFEGHDTTAASMNWVTHLIGAHPEVQAKVHEELDQVFGKDDRDVTKEDLSELKYLECCIKEALRLFPSVPMFARAINEDLQLGPYTVPAGTSLVVIVTALHRNPEIYPDPETFNPDRFLKENSRNRHPYSFVPFSAGPRNCIGQKFALMEEKTVLSHLFRNFTVKPQQQRIDLRPVGDIILRPEKGIFVDLIPRQK